MLKFRWMCGTDLTHYALGSTNLTSFDYVSRK